MEKQIMADGLPYAPCNCCGTHSPGRGLCARCKNEYAEQAEKSVAREKRLPAIIAAEQKYGAEWAENGEFA